MAFLLSTIAEYGEDGWQDYWTDLLANGAKVVDGWEDAYYGDFTAGSETGTRPIVVSYDSSPAFTVSDGVTTTAALLDTCFRQVEYAGVLKGAANPDLAHRFIDFILSTEVQQANAEQGVDAPVSTAVTLDAEQAAIWTYGPDAIAALNRVDYTAMNAAKDDWIDRWAEVFGM